MKANRETLRRFLAAAICDFVGHLDTLTDPILVGGQYPKDKLIGCLREWCDDRNFSVEDADGEGWMVACKTGSLKTPGKLPIQDDGGSDACT
jgi:hypothetical protein